MKNYLLYSIEVNKGLQKFIDGTLEIIKKTVCFYNLDK